MKRKELLILTLAGLSAGAVNGLFGGGGGMVLIPILELMSKNKDRTVFLSSVAVILPISMISLLSTAMCGPLPWKSSLPWLIGSATGGYLSAKWGKKIPALWLHRGLGILMIWGGLRNLC